MTGLLCDFPPVIDNLLDVSLSPYLSFPSLSSLLQNATISCCICHYLLKGVLAELKCTKTKYSVIELLKNATNFGVMSYGTGDLFSFGVIFFILVHVDLEYKIIHK